jgi:peptidyl-dipeptidase A
MYRAERRNASRWSSLTTLILLALLGAAPAKAQGAGSAGGDIVTVADARAFLDRAERELNALSIRASQAQWVAANFITEDTEALSAEAAKDFDVAVQRLAIESRRFDRLRLPADLRRKFTLLKLGVAAPPPSDPAEATELARITASMQADYGKGTYCRPAKAKSARGEGAPAGASDTTAQTRPGTECLQINALSRILATSRDPREMLDVWQGWHRVGAPLRDRYRRFVELSNKGARELGFTDLGVAWRSGYDMPPDAFAAEVDRLWRQVRPLYQSLHAHVRAKLAEHYGTEIVPLAGLIPAHLLGNMWAQEWGNIYPLAAPATATDPGYDVTELLRTKGVDQTEMVRIGERFFTSLGLPKLPETFWKRSLIVKPRDREVLCHASAWNIDNKEDVRIKMCTEVTGEDLVTIHHELGHNYYQLAYNKQPPLFMAGANDGFHEAIGDAIALSITPEYLRTIGLLAQVPSAAADTMLLLRQALDKVAFLPFGLLLDQWRWRVFSGEVAAAQYNGAWWDLRRELQGLSAPLPRTEADFDPGAKMHVPANVPYLRYFIARILQFQLYRALCREAGHMGPLHRCSFYGNKRAGEKLWTMMAMGTSRPWPDALEAVTGERQLSAEALLEYFAPLKAWLDEQNKGRPIGWDGSATTRATP